MTGLATGETPREMDSKLTELLNNLRTEFGVPLSNLPTISGIRNYLTRQFNSADGTPSLGDLPADWGCNPKIGARLDPPRLLGTVFVAPPQVSPRPTSKVGVPISGLDFRLNFCFEMVPDPLYVPAVQPAAIPIRNAPLWNGEESVSDYAVRIGLPPTKTLNLGGGEKIELVLVPAGEFMMGTARPVEVDRAAYQKQIMLGWLMSLVGSGAIIAILIAVIMRAMIRRQRPNFSLFLLINLTLFAGVGLIGALHWQRATHMLEREEAEYPGAVLRYDSSNQEEHPAHKVTITAPFYMGKFDVTQEQFEQVIGSNPSHFTGQNLPVDSVSWNDAQNFCRKLNDKGYPVRLPTEAEWEFACRAGTTNAYYSGDKAWDLDRIGWHSGNSTRSTHPVGGKTPNAFGLYDMLGNVRQWCDDTVSQYPDHAVIDPRNSAERGDRALRGGSWFALPVYCRAAYRSWCNPIGRYPVVGMRIVMIATAEP